MKVNIVLWQYIVSVAFLAVIEFGNAAATSARRTSTSSPPPPTSATAIAAYPRRSRKSSSTTEATKVSRNIPIALKRTGVARSTPSSHEITGSKPKDVRQLEIPKNHKKNTSPKKYTPDGINSFIENINGPIKVNLPKPTLRSEKRSPKNPRDKFICPRENEVKFDLFPIKCNRDKDCKTRTTNEICCDIFGAKSCVAGLPKPLEESSHSPIFGIIPRRCPQRPLAELWWEVKVCETDADCWPRVCCPDGQKRYCRTSQPELEIVPVPVKRSLNYLSEYLECTPPPPQIFDLHPKPCNSTLDCFPNVCCQESGKKHCRPPKKSVLTFMANFLNLGLVKRLTKNLVIK